MGEDSDVSKNNIIPQMAKISFPLGQFSDTSSVAKEWVGQNRKNIRPWTTFINTNNFKVPSSLPRLTKRIMKNIEYFHSNYLCVFIGLIIYCLLTSPLLLIAMAVCLTLCYILSEKQSKRKLVIFGRELTLQEQFGIVAICSIPLFVWAGAGAAVFWTIGASFFIITLHAAFYNIEAIVKTEDSFVEEV